MLALDEVRARFADAIAPVRQRVRAGELSQREFAPLLDEALDRAVRQADGAGIEAWALYRSVLADSSLHWADRRLAVNRLHDPSVVPEAAAAEIAPVIEAVLRDPATRYNLMLHSVMAAGILRRYRPPAALYPVTRATIDDAVVPYIEQGLPGYEGYEQQMRNLRHSMHLLATVVRLASVHREEAGDADRGVYEPLLAAQLDRVLALDEANRATMVSPEVLAADPDGPGGREIDFEPVHIMEHLAEAMEEAGRIGDPRLIEIFASRDTPAVFAELDEVSASAGRKPSRLGEYRAQVEGFLAAAAI